MRNIVVLLSGGLDSIALASMAHEGGRLGAGLFIDYGQPVSYEECRAAQAWCDRHGVPFVHRVMPLDGLADMNASPGESGPRIVPGRNLALIAVGINVALSMGLSEVWIGCTAEDRGNYPDCRQAFINPIHAPIQKAYGVDVRAPFLHKNRRDIIELSKGNGWDLSGSWSCYNPPSVGEPCGQCDSCQQGGEE